MSIKKLAKQLCKMKETQRAWFAEFMHYQGNVLFLADAIGHNSNKVIIKKDKDRLMVQITHDGCEFLSLDGVLSSRPENWREWVIDKKLTKQLVKQDTL